MTASQPPTGSRLRVLIVEDIDINRDLLVQLLEESHDLAVASDGEEGLRLAKEWRPDVVLLDLSLPKLDGWSVAQTLRALPTRSKMIVVALTAHAMAGDEERALAAGCDAYLAKPIDDDRLFDLLAAAARSRENRA